MEENLKNIKFNKDQKVMRSYDNPITKTGGVIGLKGNLASEGAIVKVAGLKKLRIVGKAKCFDSEEEAFEAVKNKKYKEGDVIVIRYEGPKGGPWDARNAFNNCCDLRTRNGRKGCSNNRWKIFRRYKRFLLCHVGPEAYVGGMIGLLNDSDKIIIDAENGSINVELDDNEIEKRKKKFGKRKSQISEAELFRVCSKRR